MLAKIYKNTKNYVFIIIWILYLSYYFLGSYKDVSSYVSEYVSYWDTILSYINAIIAFLTVIGLIWIINKFLIAVLERITDKTDTRIDNLFVDYLNKFVRTTKHLIWLYIFFLFIHVPLEYQFYIWKFFYVLFLIIFIYYFTNFLNVSFEALLIKKTKFKSLNKSLLSFLKKIIIVTTWIIWVLTVLSNLGYNVTALITWAWIWGLAIALAAQKTLSNIFWAITVLLTKPFWLWDYIKIDWQVGTVKEMWISHLTMIDKEGYFVLIPNEKLISSNIENLTKRETRRWEFSIWIVYATSLAKTKEAVEIIENILQDYIEKNTISYFRVNFDTFWDFSLNIRTVYFSTLNEDYKQFVKQKEEINMIIKDKFAKAKIEMAFPTQEVILKK